MTIEVKKSVTINRSADELERSWATFASEVKEHLLSTQFVQQPGSRGTMMAVYLRYDPPAGKVGQVMAKLFQQDPEQQVSQDLRQFKSLMETGEIPSTEDQPAGRRDFTSRVIRSPGDTDKHTDVTGDSGTQSSRVSDTSASASKEQAA